MWIIYKHTCTITNKSYIGFTKHSMEFRWNQHCLGAAYSSPHNHFHNALRLYGTECWTHEVIAENIPSREEACVLERHFIRLYDTFENGYNSTIGGEGACGVSGDRHPLKGRKQTKEHINNVRTAYKRAMDNRTEEDKQRVFESGKKRMLLVNNTQKVKLYHRDYGVVEDYPSDICRRYGLINKSGKVDAGIYKVINGEARQRKGWFLWKGENANYDLYPVYIFKHPEYGTEELRAREFSRKYNISIGHVSGIINGTCKTAHGWRFVGVK